MGVTAEMAKAKRKGARSKPDVPELRKNRISIRGTEGWYDWLVEYAAFRRIPVTSLIDQVLNEAAKRDGFPLPPER